MTLSTMILSVMQAIVRHLGQEIHTIQITFIAALEGVIFLILVSLVKKQALHRSRRKGLLLIRGLLLAFSNIVFFYGLTLTPLAEATAISFVGIVFAFLAAALFLKESMYMQRWITAIVSLAGIIMILRPGYISPSPGAYAVLLSSLTWGLSMVVAKVLSRTETTIVILGSSLLVITLVSGTLAFPVWTVLTITQWSQALSIGFLGTIGHLAATKSLQMSDATVVVPINCTRLIWAAVIGLLIFGEFPDTWTIFGSLLIVFSIIFLSRFEAQHSI